MDVPESIWPRLELLKVISAFAEKVERVRLRKQAKKSLRYKLFSFPVKTRHSNFSVDLVEVPIEFCNLTCTDGQKCGGTLGKFSVYDAEGSRPTFVSFDLTESGENVVVENIDTGGINSLFYLQIGHESTPFQLDDTAKATLDPITIPKASLTPGENYFAGKISTFFLNIDVFL